MNKYRDLFSLLENTIKKQDSQKKRGLNNYNMVNVVRKATHEVGMHSNIIYSLINPNGQHFQGDLFLNVFIEEVVMPELGLKKLEDFGNVHSVRAEELTEGNRRIDFTIKSDKYLIGIEMKVNAYDLDHQVSHYFGQLEKESDGQTKDNVYIFYLTKFGTKPSQKSLEIKKGENTKFDPSKHVQIISFEKHILNWIDTSQKEVKNITNLNMALNNYKDIVSKITNKNEGNVVTIEEELLNNKKELLLALELDKKMNRIKGKTLFNFFDKLSILLGDKGFQEDDIILSNFNARLITEVKCLDQIKKSKNKPNYFGKTFSLNNRKVLYVFVAVKSLCYGILDLSKQDSDFGDKNISNGKFKTYFSSLECAINIQDELYDLIAEDTKFLDKLLKYISKHS